VSRSYRGSFGSRVTPWLTGGSAAREGGQPSPDADDDESMVDVDRRVLLSDLVGHLPQDQRVVVERFVERKSIREIARELQGTEGAVKQL